MSIQTILQSDFSLGLKSIPDQPKLLYFRGDDSLIHTPCLSIVGTRKMTPYGKMVLENFIPLISPYVTIVSGLAFGIDSYAHELALKYGGHTIAILPGGIDDQTISPKSNLELAQNILENKGLLLSEYSEKTPVYKSHFHQRNRLIAALSHVTLIVEAAKKSGSMITAFHALNYNRNVCAIPGNIKQPLSEGTNYLISKGATVITDVETLLSLYTDTPTFLNKNKKKSYSPTNNNEKKLIEHLSEKPISIDQLTIKSNLPIATISITLSCLELKDVITVEHGMIRLI